MSHDKRANLQSWLNVGLFMFAVFGGLGSYFKSMSDIRQEIQAATYSSADRVRDETKASYATKEETRFIQTSLNEIKQDLKEIKAELKRR